ncbi:UPF0481 protein [Acorus calamus]|uniref:UPF0481 protein n=1 Tax=Acorus calamus TaxID=4465 RepID=A0AAV9DUI1_ACOCL|nr:UPF0481 protein [Acorus calamus]
MSEKFVEVNQDNLIRKHRSVNPPSHFAQQEGSESKGKDITIETLGKSMSMKMKEAASCNKWRTGTCSIFRVPVRLRGINFKTFYQKETRNGPYDPKYVSIGPYHHGVKGLQTMEEFKWRALDILTSESKTSIEVCIEKMKKLEVQARSCYSEKIKMRGEEFVEMMLLDVCFVLMVLTDRLDELETKKGNNNGQGRGRISEVLSKNVLTDLLMLENQIPFFILREFFHVLKLDSNYWYDIEEVALTRLLSAYPGYKYSDEVLETDIYHLLHLFCLSIVDPLMRPKRDLSINMNSRLITMANKFKEKVNGVLPNCLKRRYDDLLPRFEMENMIQEAGEKGKSKWIPSVTELEGFGVKFKTKEAQSFMDLEFRDGVMEIPTLILYPYTQTIFHNIIAFEQCFTTKVEPQTTAHISHYVMLMDFLIGNTRDIVTLQDKEIITNWLGSQDEVVRVFNHLRRGVIDFSRDYFSDIYSEVNEYRRRRCPKWWAKFKLDYCNSPWSCMGTAWIRFDE